jgi:hypothetical protein
LATIAVMVLTACFVGGFALADDGEPLFFETAVYRDAKGLLKDLRKRGVKNVGILKFLVAKGDGPLKDNFGPINLTAPASYETALIVRNSPKEAERVGILRDANAVASKIPGANHLTPEGRAKLFTTDYPLAWGGKSVKPDAFLTGEIRYSDDLKEMDVRVLFFTRDSENLEEMRRFKCLTGSRNLVNGGFSFTRGLFDKGSPKMGGAERLAQASREALLTSQSGGKRTANPATSDKSPVELVVLYGPKTPPGIKFQGKPIPFEIVDGKAFVPEPNEQQDVALLIRKKDPSSKETFAVVVKVNGQNTLFKETQSAERCHQWLLGPNNPEKLIEGFQVSDTEVRKFVVRSPEESRANEVRYGDDVGIIQMIVFKELAPDAKPDDLPPDSRPDALESSVQLGQRNDSLAPPNEDFETVQARLGGASGSLRGLIEDGAPHPGNIQRVKFKLDPVPIQNVAVTYYSKKSPPAPAP